MTYLDVEGLRGIESCKIISQPCKDDGNKEQHDLKFENGLAVAKVFVKAVDFYNERYEYETFTVIKEVRDKDTNKVVDYELANKDERYFQLKAFVKAIYRTGNHFFFEVLTGDDDNRVSWNNYWHYEYDESNNVFTKIGKLPGKPTITKNPDLIIISGSQLYSLSKKENIGVEHSQIEDIDGNNFFVLDCIRAKTDTSLSNHLMFIMDKEGERTSKVFSRNIGEFLEDEIALPYLDIKKRETMKLDDLITEEAKYKQLMIKAKEEQ